MKLATIITTSLTSLFSLNCLAAQYTATTINPDWNRIAIQAAIATGGTLSIGVADYTEKTEIGLTVSGSVNNASRATKNVTLVIFGGLRHALGMQTYFAWGLDVAGTFGKTNGQHISSNYQVGPYISLEQMLTKNLMLTGWIQPYMYQYVKYSGTTSTSTNNFFNSGGIGFNYLF